MTTVAEKAKGAAEGAVTTGKELLDAGKKAVDAAKKGDMSTVTQITDGIREITRENGEKIREFTGAEAFKKILEPISKDGIMGIFAALANLFKFFTGGMKFSETLSSVGAAVSGAVGAVSGKPPEVTPPEKTPAEKVEANTESVMGNIKDKVIEDLRTNWGFDLNDKKKSAGFKEVWDNHKEKLHAALIDSQAFFIPGKTHNPFDTALSLGLFAPTFLFDLVAK